MADDFNPEAVMTFGKHEGETIDSIPSYYLRWLLDEEWFEEKHPQLCLDVEGEWNWREHHGRHFG